MENLYGAVASRLDGLDFSALWPGFTRGPFALYRGQTVWTEDGAIPRDHRFLGNTSILLDGAPTAIWNIEGGEDPDELAASVVHEMFHSFQMARGEKRFPDDLALLRLGIDESELALRALECEILSAERPSLSQLADARMRRRAVNPPLTREAERAETVEGMAEYMGMAALSMWAPEKAARMGNAHRMRLRDAGLLPDARRMAYFSGALLLATARDAGLVLDHHVGCEARSLGEIILAQVRPQGAGAPPDVSAIARAEKARAAELCRSFNGTRTERPGRITGYDPMNMVRAGDLILCTQFVMLDGELASGPLLLEMAAGSKDEVIAVRKTGP